MKQIVTAILLITITLTLIVAAFTLRQVSAEEETLSQDMERRSLLVGDTLRETIQPQFVDGSHDYLQTVVERYSNRERLAGLVVYDNREFIVASSSILSPHQDSFRTISAESMDANTHLGEFVRIEGQKYYVFALPLHDEQRVVGSLALVQNAGFIDRRLSQVWKENLMRLLIQALLFTAGSVLLIRWVIISPIVQLVQFIRDVRIGKSGSKGYPTNFLLKPLVKEVSTMGQSLREARLIASEEARLRLEKLDTPWTAQRLQEFIKEILKNRKLFVVSNREPYIHVKSNGSVQVTRPASGMVTALEPIMQACGGTWIAHGSGSADQEVVNSHDKIQVPPEDPKYTLHRIWLSREEEEGYYYGFANEGLWPLCHISHARPIFRREDWEMYKLVNAKFAKAVLREIRNTKHPVILLQDYHLALVPDMIRSSRPDALVAIFWHIPWPNAESFKICPWRKELLNGLLGADLVGFHIQLHCNNFLDTVSQELESLINWEQFAIQKDGHVTHVKPFPISIAFTGTQDREENNLENVKREIQGIRKAYQIVTPHIGLGVDRMDYTKGIIERLDAVELYFEAYPQAVKKFTFIQIAAPTRSQIIKYKEFSEEVIKKAESINRRFKVNGWKPIVLINKHHEPKDIMAFYKMADVCLVTSLHDGMNLVAKEFISARSDNRGVLILSEFTGASRELTDAVIVNPYDTQNTAEAIQKALAMPETEQARRMRRMRNRIKNYNIYRWSAELLRAMSTLDIT